MFIHSFAFNSLFHFTLVGIGYKFILSLDNKSNIEKNENIKTENVKNETKYNYVNPTFGPF